MAGDTSTVFVCETNEDTKSWTYFGAKKHLTELLKWFDPKKYESEVILTRRVRMLKDAHENNLVPSHSEIMSNLSDTISIGFNHEIETLIPKTLTCFKSSELSCKFCGYQTREGERHCRSCHTTFLVNSKNKSSLKKFLDHEKRCAKKKVHKHIASMDTESLNRLGVVKCSIGKMELALTYLNALTDKHQDSQRVAWHEYLKRAISPEMTMEVRTFLFVHVSLVLHNNNNNNNNMQSLLNLQSRLKDAWLDEKWLSLGTHIELGSEYFDPEDTIPRNLCVAMKFGHSIAGVEIYRRMLARAIRNPRSSKTPRGMKKMKFNNETMDDGGQF